MESTSDKKNITRKLNIIHQKIDEEFPEHLEECRKTGPICSNGGCTFRY